VELLVARCAGLDVAKDEVVACVRVPDGRGGRQQQVRTFQTFTTGLEALADWLVYRLVPTSTATTRTSCRQRSRSSGSRRVAWCQHRAQLPDDRRGRARSFRMRVAEPEPSRALTESDAGSSMVTTWVVTRRCRAVGCGWRRAGRARVGSEGCSSGGLRRGCCVGCMPRSWSGSTVTPRTVPSGRAVNWARVSIIRANGACVVRNTPSLT
jgi:hypothetical protein